MIVKDPYKGRDAKEVSEIEKVLKVDIPKKVEGREQGFGDNWSDDKEKELQDWLDKKSNQYEFNFRLMYATSESLYPKDYQKVVIYG